MPASAVKKLKSKWKKKFQIEKKSVLIKNEILVIFEYLQTKLKRFRYHKLRKQIRNSFKLKKTRFFLFAILRCCKNGKKKRLLKLIRAFEIEQFCKRVWQNKHRGSQNSRIN